MITLVLMAGSTVMAMNIFLPVLPLIAQDLHVSDADSQYVLTLFLGMTAIAQLFIGPLADRFGRRPVLLTTQSIFVAATLVCILAQNIETLLIGRALQASSAASIALSRAIVRDLFDRSKAASMIGYVTMAMAVIPMVSPTIGGYAGEAFGWRGPFVILFISGVLLWFLLYVDLGETHSSGASSLRQQMQSYGQLLREPIVWGYFTTATLVSGAYFAFLGGAPFVGQKMIGMSPSQLGMYFAIVAIGYIFGNFLSGRYSQRIGIEPMMAYGGFVAAIGAGIALFLMYRFEPQAGYLFYPMILVGMGNGMALPNANAGAISVRPDLAGSASGLGGSLQIGGGAALAVLSGELISIENQALPLYIIMFVSSAAGALIAGLLFYHTRSKNSE